MNFCSGAHRTAYYQKAFERPPVSRELAGFKPSLVAFEPHAAAPPEAQEHGQALRLPGIWHLSSTSKRGVSGRQGFSHKKVAAAIVAPVRGKPVPVAAEPQRIQRCILPEPANPTNRSGSISQATTLYVPALSPAPDRLPELREGKASWKDPGETFERPALRDSLPLWRRAPKPALTPESGIIPAIQASESQPVLDGRWLRQPPRIGLGAEHCLPEASRFERAEGPRVARIDAAAAETRMVEPQLANVVSRHLVSIVKPRGDMQFRLATTLAAQLGSAVAPLPGVVRPRKARMEDRDRAPLSTPAKIRRPAAIELAGLMGPHQTNSWAKVRRPSPHLPEMPVPSELTMNPERVRRPLRIGYNSTAKDLGPSQPALGAAGQRTLHVPAESMPDECAPIQVLKLRKGSVDLEVRRLIPILTLPAPAELRPAETRPLLLENEATLVAQNFRREIAMRSKTGSIPASLTPVAMHAAGSTWTGIRNVPDSPANLAFRDRSHAFSPRLAISSDAARVSPQLARFAGSTVLPWTPAEGQITTAEVRCHSPVQHPVAIPPMAPMGIAPALSKFASVGPSVEGRASLLAGLRERLFHPIPPPSQPRLLKPPEFEFSKPLLSLARTPVALDHRWDRSRKMWDRGGRWKRPAKNIVFADLRFQLGSALGGVHNHRDS